MHQSDTNSYTFCRDLKPENILLDTKGAFEADDETGTVFKELYEVIEKLETYYAEETKEEE